MAGPGICVLCLADTCTSEVHPVFNPVAPYGYLLSDMYLFIAPIAQSVSALDFNFERAVEGSILTADKKVESEEVQPYQ